MMYGLIIGLVAVLFVLCLMLLAPAIEVWRADRRKRRRGGMIR